MIVVIVHANRNKIGTIAELKRAGKSWKWVAYPVGDAFLSKVHSKFAPKLTARKRKHQSPNGCPARNEFH